MDSVLAKSSKFFTEVDKNSASSDEFGEVKTAMVRSFNEEVAKQNYCAALVMHIGLYIFGFGLGMSGFSIISLHSHADVNAHDLERSFNNKIADLCMRKWKQPESRIERSLNIWQQDMNVEKRINELWSGQDISLVETYKNMGGREFFDKKWPGGDDLTESEKGQRLLKILFPRDEELIGNLSEDRISNEVGILNDIVKQYMCPGTVEKLDLFNVAGFGKMRRRTKIGNEVVSGTANEIANKLEEMLGKFPEMLHVRSYTMD